MFTIVYFILLSTCPSVTWRYYAFKNNDLPALCKGREYCLPYLSVTLRLSEGGIEITNNSGFQ